MASKAILGAQNITTNPCFSSGLVTDSDSLHVWTHRDKCPSVISSPREPREKARHASQLEFCLVFSPIVFQASPAENVWPLRSKSAHSPQLFYVWTVHSCGHGSVQMICELLACKQRVVDAFSVKTLVWRSPGLLDLLR